MALRHCGTVRLETGRLILRQFITTDAESILTEGLVLRDEKIWKPLLKSLIVQKK